MSFKFPLQCKAKLQPALNVLIVFSSKLPLRLFIDKSSEIRISLKPILLRIMNFYAKNDERENCKGGKVLTIFQI